MRSLTCIVMLGLTLCLSGCMDAAHWWSRTAFKTDCRPEKLTPDGRCVQVKKGNANVTTAHP
jgi:hypothetical protein